MRVNHYRRLMLGAAAAAVLWLSLPVQTATVQAQADPAANYPDRPIRLIVPFAAGGGNDIFARLVGQRASEILGQPIVVENRPGAGGRIAADHVLKQPADGYTLFVAAIGVMSVAAAAYPNLSYHPTKSFTPLAMIAEFPLVAIVKADHPAKTLKELVDWAKANPDKANYASTSPAFIIATELLKLTSGMPGTMIPYKSSAEMVTSVMAGHTLLAMSDGPPAMPMIKGGKVRALAVTGDKRSLLLPDVPSMAEAGYPEVDFQGWIGLFAPTETPPAIVERLEAVIRKSVADPGVRAKLSGMAVIPAGGPAAEFRARIDREIEVYTKIVKAANLTFK